MQRLIQDLRLSSNALVLDAGCGSGEHYFRFVALGYRCVGVDLSKFILTAARKEATFRGLASRAHFACQALEQLAFKDGTFDAVHCRGVLMHIPGWEVALANLCRVLKPGNRIAILESNHRSLETRIGLLLRNLKHGHAKMIRTEGGIEFWSQDGEQPFVVRVANLRRLSQELERNGVRVVKRFAHEFVDINRFPAGILRGAAMRINELCFRFDLPPAKCFGNVLIGQKRE